jgi:multiple sugar transport system ATP-binding protein
MGATLTVRALTRRFSANGAAAVDRVDFEVGAGETLCLVGPSGCGKSTTLRLVAGLDTPDAGSIVIDGRDVRAVAPQDRDVAMVFQGFALYPHMTVRAHLAFPLELRKVPRAERQALVASTAEMLSLTRLLDRRPAELSGGERQRVAMGRAVVRRPKVFLFDEPLSNLDAGLRAELRVELGALLRRLGATALYVTHDQTEAMTLGHRIALMRAGRIEQLDTPRRIYAGPATVFAARFFGSPPMNLVPATVSGGMARAGSLALPAPPGAPERVLCGIRPEEALLCAPEGPGGLPAEVVSVEPHGPETHLDVAGEGWTLRLRVPGFAEQVPGAPVRVHVPPERVHWFDSETERALAPRRSAPP